MSSPQQIHKDNYIVKVNGTQFEMLDPNPTALQILEHAKVLGAIPGEPSNYILEGDKSKYLPQQHVDLFQDNVFITIPNTPTPVA